MSRSRLKGKFIDLYLDYYPMVYSMAYSGTGDMDIAEDLCQEVFIIFYEKFDSVSSTGSWLKGTTRNVLMNYYRKKSTGEDNFDDPDKAGHTFTNGYRDTRMLIKEAITSLDCDENEKMLINLIGVHNFSYTSAAELLGLTRRQAQYKYNVVAKKLISYLKSKGIKEMEDLL